MKKLICLALYLLVFNADATVIFTTGPGSDEGGSGGGPTLSVDQWARVQFTLDENTTITDISGFIGSTDGGDFTIAIYDNSEGGHNPVGTELFSATTEVSPNSPNGWYGPTDISWDIEAGTYWASFEVRAGQSFYGWHRGWNPPLPSDPLPALTQNFINHDDWMVSNDWYGLQIEAVPLPTAVWLFSSGLIGLIGLARRKSL